MNYDLIIVGAGPAGIFTALELKRVGSKKKILLIGYGNITTHEQDMLKDYLSDSLLGYTISSINTYFCKEDELEACLKTFGGIDRG